MKKNHKNETHKIVEKFISINGEGQRAGELAVFIRLKGCNLNCSYCDTSWANETDAQYEKFTNEEIYNYIEESHINNITITGGEPLLNDNLVSLLEFILIEKKDITQNKYNIEIETNGSVSLKKFLNISPNISFTMDYKLQSSEMEEKMDRSNLLYLEKKDTLKFVVGDYKDLETAQNIILENNLIDRGVSIYFSPVFGAINPEEIVEFMILNKLNDVKLQLQLHKYIWDPKKKGV